jgi:esterase
MQMTERQPRLQWTEIAGAGHYVHDDQPAAFTQLLTDFLAGVAS